MILNGHEAHYQVTATPLPPNDICKERFALGFALAYVRPRPSERERNDMTDAHVVQTTLDADGSAIGYGITGKMIRAPMAIGTRKLKALLRKGTVYYAESVCACGKVSVTPLENWRRSSSLGCTTCVSRSRKQLLDRVANPKRTAGSVRPVDRRRQERTADRISERVAERRKAARV